MQKLNLITYLSSLSFLLISCSTATDKCTNVNQARIHQSYSVDYDQEKNKTSVSAQVRFGGSSGTTLENDGKCKFEHNLYSLSINSFLGTSYEASRTGLDLDHTFTFTNNEGQTYSNSASILAIAFSSPPTFISKASGFTINWTGGGVRAKETVYVYVSDQNRTVLDSTSVQGATSMSFDASKLTTLANGTGNMYLKRYYNTSEGLSVAEVGGFISAAYQTSKITVTIGN